jgi:MFS family permease
MIIPFIHVFTGIFWSGIDLTSNNLVMSLSPDENRSFYVASFSMVTSVVGSIVAYALGGLFMEVTAELARNLNIVIFGHQLTNYHMLFILSAVIRFIAITFLVSPIHEDESVEPKEMIRRSIHMIVDKREKLQRVQG